MRIRSVEVFHLRAPLERPFHWATGTARERHAVLLKIESDAGLTGWGEALRPQAARVASDSLAPALVGRNPLERLALVAQMRVAASGPPAARAAAVGAAEIALWDLAAQAAGQPLHRLLGDALRESVAVYASGFYYDDGDMPNEAAEARSYLARGFTRFKMKIGRLSPSDDMKRVAAVRAAVGPQSALMVDGNQVYTADAAAELEYSLTEAAVNWLEEPLRADDLAGYRALKARTRIHLAAGENLHGRTGFEPFLVERLLEVAQPNVAGVGGLSAALAVARDAHTNGARVALHHWGTPVALAASLHLACCLPADAGEPLVEFDLTPNPLREIAAGQLTEPRSCALTVPEGPGLGVTPDEQAITRFCLHVEKFGGRRVF